MAEKYICPRCRTATYAGCASGGCCGPVPPAGPVVCRRCGTVLRSGMRMFFQRPFDEE